MATMEPETHFNYEDLLAALRERREVVFDVISRIPAGQVLVMDGQELTDRVVKKCDLIPLKLSDNARLVRMYEGLVDIPPMQGAIESESTTQQVMGIHLKVEIPCSGDGWLILGKRESSTTYSTHPTVAMESGYVRLMLGLLLTMDSDAAEKAFEKSIALAERYVDRINDHINSYNGELRDLVSRELENRRKRVEKLNEFRKVIFSTCGRMEQHRDEMSLHSSSARKRPKEPSAP